MNLFISRHKILCCALYNGFMWAVFLLFNFFAVMLSPGWWILFGAFILFISVMCVNASDQLVLGMAGEELNNNCDPYPLLETACAQLQKVKSKSYRQVLLINKMTALRELGEYAESKEILESVNIDQYTGTLPVTKIIYYNNLVDILMLTGNTETALIWHKKLLRMAADFKGSKKNKTLIDDTLKMTGIEISISLGKLDEAESFLTSLAPVSNRQIVEKTYLLAMIYIKQGRPIEAKEFLQYVINNGNKLYIVEHAKILLEEIS